MENDEENHHQQCHTNHSNIFNFSSNELFFGIFLNPRKVLLQEKNERNFFNAFKANANYVGLI